MGLNVDAPLPGVERSVGGGVAWELTVDPDEIVSGQTFGAVFKGKAIFDERILITGQVLPGLLPGGFKDIMVADFRATVHVRDGAVGEDVELTPDPEAVPYVCAESRTSCNPANDILDDPPKPPGLRANTDCEPLAGSNPCGQFVKLDTSDDCDPGGICHELGQTGEGSPCELNDFCVSGPLELVLTGPPGGYVADRSGTVLFGYDDSKETGFYRLVEDGCNDGTWYSEIPKFIDPVGSNGVRMMLRGDVPLAIEFVMGEDSRGDEGIDSCDPRSSPSPNSSLIKFPIRAQAQ
jgi:hypothetical protein